jgi:hypothetical protein
MGRLAANAFTTLGQLRGRDTYSMPFYRHALDELATNRDPTLGEMAQRDPHSPRARLAPTRAWSTR